MIQTAPEIDSTNAALVERLRSGVGFAEGDWLVADRQSAGRGRMGREWFDGAGNFMGSTVVDLRHGDPDPATLSLVTGLAVHAAVVESVSDAAALMLKWPNDLIAGGAKLGGILLERIAQVVVVGIGVNLESAPQVPDCRTTSIAELGTAPARDDFANVLTVSFADELERWRSAGLAQAIRRWSAISCSEGTNLQVNLPDGTTLDGAFAGLTEDGALRLALAGGAMRVIHAGDVRLLHDNQ